jgi:uncharacterized protein (TIGR02145 family)
MNRLTLFVILAALTVSCEKNSPLVIGSLKASRDTARVGDTVKIDCAFTGPGSKTLEFDWTCAQGGILVDPSATDAAFWIAPEMAGPYTIKCTITGKQETAADSVMIQVRNMMGTFTDSRDQRVYQWVRIGSKTWMAENLTWLPAINTPSQGSRKEKRYYVYGYSGYSVEDAVKTPGFLMYGALYNWFAAVDGDTMKYFSMSRLQGVCPDGWHLPELGEVRALFAAVGPGYAIHIKSVHGWEGNTNGDNLSGLNIFPAGYRYENSGFINRGFVTSFWVVPLYNPSSVWSFQVYYNSGIQESDIWDATGGFSVRCVKDE